MTTLGISGHRGLTAGTARLVGEAMGGVLDRYPSDLVGVSCIADGADSLFAEAVLARGGRLVVVVPAARYRAGLPAEHRATYDRLLAAASAVHRLDFGASTAESHMAASERMLDLVDELVAVWDGQPARGFGGTANVVEAARRRGIPVSVVWPAGAERD